jgi:hypothetical protein
MGRTLPATTKAIFDQIAELEPFYLVLRRSDQLILDRFFETVFQHRTAISNAMNLLPIEVMPFAILVEEYKRIDNIRNELFNRIEMLKNQLKLISPPS